MIKNAHANWKTKPNCFNQNCFRCSRLQSDGIDAIFNWIVHTGIPAIKQCIKIELCILLSSKALIRTCKCKHSTLKVTLEHFFFDYRIVPNDSPNAQRLCYSSAEHDILIDSDQPNTHSDKSQSIETSQK